MLSVGLVGLPNAGKSTLFNALTNNQVAAENFPFCTIEPHTGIVEVPDQRVEELAKIFESEKQIFTGVEFRDIAGLVKDAAEGAGLGNQFLSHIREVDMILMVVRRFASQKIIHVENRVDPEDDVQILLLELALFDLKLVEKQLQSLEKEAKKGADRLVDQKLEILQDLQEKLKQGRPALDSSMSEQNDPDLLKWRETLNLLTDKPLLVVGNVIEGGENLAFDADFNLDISQELALSQMSPEERLEFVGTEKTGLDQLIVNCYQKLGLATYFTAGTKETRAWTFKKGATAPEAAGVIHSDFERKFIRGQVVKYQELLESGSLAKAKESGKLQMVGKNYLVQDGDVCEWII